MTDHDSCAVCGATVHTAHTQEGDTVRTVRWCSADPSHAYGTRGVAR